VGLACFDYRSAPADQVVPGREARIELTDDGSRALAPVIGPGTASLVGRIVDADSTAVHVRLIETTNRRGIATTWSGEPATVPRAAIVTLGERTISRSKTVGLAAIFVGLMVGGYFALRGGAGVGVSTTGNGGHTGQ
jgi:hypothetical protein